MLSKRPLQSSPVIALKGLITMQTLLQQGSNSCQVACHNKISLLGDIANTFRSQHGSTTIGTYHQVASSYASVLYEKVSFHNTFPSFERNYSIDLKTFSNQPVHSGKESHDFQRDNALTYLLKILDMVFISLKEGFALLKNKQGEIESSTGEKKLARILPISSSGERSGLGKRGEFNPIELVVAMLILMLREADLLYEICGLLIFSQTSFRQGKQYDSTNWDVTHHKAKFQAQHKMLRFFFELAKMEGAITCRVTPPNLPLNPPSSFWNKDLNNEIRSRYVSLMLILFFINLSLKMA